MEITSKKEMRIIADFNRGKLTAKQAGKMLKRAAVRKGRKSKKPVWK